MRISAKRIMNTLAEGNDLLKEISDIERDNLHKVLLGILSDLVNVCDKYNLKIALVGGSALGAVRHGGFIPWDDDIDLGMLREDWEVLKSIFDSTLGDKYDLEAANYCNKDCKNTWGKVYLKGSVLEEIQDINTPYNKGIFVDIFIYENVSPSLFIRRIDALLSDFFKGVATSLSMYKYPNELEKSFYSVSFSSRCYYRLRCFLGWLFSWCSHKAFCNWYDQFVSRHKKDIGLYTTPTGRNNYLGEIISKEKWDLVQVDFDGVRAYVYNGVESYLRQLYGDSYMIIPPLNKRERHFIVRLVFPDVTSN